MRKTISDRTIVNDILDIVEDKLREFSIQIPDDDREDSTDPIVGYHYAELHDRIKEYLEEAGFLKDLHSSEKHLAEKDLKQIRAQVAAFYAGVDEYTRDLEDTFVFVGPAENIFKTVLGEQSLKQLQMEQSVKEHLEDEDGSFEEFFGGYPYGVKAEDVTEEQISRIAQMANTVYGFTEIHEAALKVLGEAQVVENQEEKTAAKQYKIVLTEYDFQEPEPYTEELPDRYETREQAQLAMSYLVMDELASLNGIDADGNFPERRFIATSEDTDHDIVINAWDGPDYRPVTCYNIVEV